MNSDKPDFNFEYSVTRRKRKTVSLIVEPTGVVRILAPLRFSDKNITALLQEKQSWVLEKLRIVKSSTIVPPDFLEGTELDYQGKMYAIKYEPVIRKSDECIAILHDQILIFSRSFEKEVVKKSIESWYKKEATLKIQESVLAMQKRMDKLPTKISVKTQKKRWGSCTSKGHILLNWRLILAPQEVLDYVILHELCHLYFMDHSPKFWAKVSEFDPKYKEKRDWLKRNGHIIRWPYDSM